MTDHLRPAAFDRRAIGAQRPDAGFPERLTDIAGWLRSPDSTAATMR